MRTVFLFIRKELTQVFRDKVMRIQILIPPIIQLLVLSQAATFEVRHTDVSLLDFDQSPASERLVEHMEASGRFDVAQQTYSQAQADQALLNRDAGLLLRVPNGFERDLRRTGAAEIQLILNAEDGAAAGIVQSYVQRILQDYAHEENIALRPVTQQAQVQASGLDIRTRGLYNPGGGYLDYMAIGFLAALATLIGILITSQNIARENEIGTLEQLNVTPISKAQFIAGKLLPFWLLGLFEVTLGLIVIKVAFGTPFVGNLLVVYAGTGVYLVAALALGLLISTVVSTQQQAQFLTFFVLVLFFFLGGLFTPVASMPEWVQVIAEGNPIKHFVALLRGVLMKGATLSDVMRPILAMAMFGAVTLALAVWRYRKTAA